MKKMILAIATFLTAISFVNAEINTKILDYAKETHVIAGENIKLNNADIVRVERFLTQNEIDDTTADSIISKLEAVKTIMNNEGTSDFTKLSSSKKQEVFALAEEAAELAGVTLSYDNSEKVLYVYKDGVRIEAIEANKYLKQTGNSNTLYINIAIISVLGLVVYRKIKNA